MNQELKMQQAVELHMAATVNCTHSRFACGCGSAGREQIFLAVDLHVAEIELRMQQNYTWA
jgi:hypothetical protein